MALEVGAQIRQLSPPELSDLGILLIPTVCKLIQSLFLPDITKELSQNVKVLRQLVSSQEVGIAFKLVLLWFFLHKLSLTQKGRVANPF